MKNRLRAVFATCCHCPACLQGKGKWVPPEAAAVAAQLAESNSSWQCGSCTLLNAPAARTCEACGQLRPGPLDADNRWKQQQGASQPPPSVRHAAPVQAEAPVVAVAAPAQRQQQGAAAAAALPLPPPPSADAFPSLPPAAASGASQQQRADDGGSGGGKKGGGKKGKQALDDFMRQTARVHPQVWCGGGDSERGLPVG